MRVLGLLAAAISISAACTSPNPAWLLTDPANLPSSGGSSAGSSGSTSALTTTTEASTTGSTGGTSTPVTTGSDTTTSGGPGSTGAMGCGFPDSPDLELTYSTSVPTGCDPTIIRQAHAEVIGQAGLNQWKFNVCGSESVCKDPNMPCDDGEHVIFTFDGPPELVPTFVPGECHQFHVVPRIDDPEDPQSCKLRLLRIAHTRYTPYVVHYIGAISVPGTAGLPGKADWFSLLGFELVSMLAAACVDDMNCQPAVGTYEYIVHWGNQAVEYGVPEGGTFDEQIVAIHPNQQMVEIKGRFTAVRARIEPGLCGTGQDFKWVWLADVPPP